MYVVTIYYIEWTVPFEFIYYEDSQAHQYDWHEHDDCSAAVAAIAAVHERSFEGERMKEELSAHAGQMRINAYFYLIGI